MIPQVVSHNTPNISVLSTVLQATVQHILLTRLKFLHIAPIQYPSTYTILLSSRSLKRFTVRIVNRDVLFFYFFHCNPTGLIFISSRSRASSVTSRHVYSSLPFAARYHGYDKFLVYS